TLILLLIFFFFFYSYAHHRYLHSFPTRRSSDLKIARGGLAAFALIGSLMAGGPSSAQVTLNVNSVAAQNLLGSDHLAADLMWPRSEEHTSELQSLRHLVCRLLLEKKKDNRLIQM